MACIDAEAESIKKWVLTGKAGTEQAASDLLGLTSKWKYATLSKEAFSLYAAQLIGEKTHTAHQYQLRVQDGIAGCQDDIHDIELTLADQMNTECNLGSAGEKGVLQKLPDKRPDVSSDVGTAILNDVLTTCASEGIGWLIAFYLAPETWGASLVFMVPIDFFLSWLVDGEDKLKQKLDTGIDALADEYEKAFRTEMIKVLDERKQMWEKAL